MSKHLKWALPGHGDDCGSSGWSTSGHSTGDRVHVHRYENSCGGRNCPRHYHKWASAGARAAAERIGPSRFHQRVIVSFPIGAPPDTDDALQVLFRRVYDILRFVGATGGLAMFHAERIPTTANERTDTDEGPHFHCVVDNVLDTERILCVSGQTDIVVKGMGRARDLASHVQYVLSHLGIPLEDVPVGQVDLSGVSLNPAIGGIVETRLHTIRWFGAWCRLKTTENTGRYCPFCKKEIPEEHWARVRWIPYDRGPPEDEWIDGTCDEWAQVNQYGWGE